MKPVVYVWRDRKAIVCHGKPWQDELNNHFSSISRVWWGACVWYVRDEVDGDVEIWGSLLNGQGPLGDGLFLQTPYSVMTLSAFPASRERYRKSWRQRAFTSGDLSYQAELEAQILYQMLGCPIKTEQQSPHPEAACCRTRAHGKDGTFCSSATKRQETVLVLEGETRRSR